MFDTIRSFFSGKKTYLSSAAGVIVFGAYAFGFITFDQAITLAGLVGFTGLAALRAAVTK